jgi:hypothetical protein
VFAGLPDVLRYLESFHFAPADLDALRSLHCFEDGFLQYLAIVRFTGGVRVLPGGSLFFANEPVLEVTTPVIEAQLVETFLVNQVNLQTILATKASRVVHAARGRQLIDFAARRTHGVEAANTLARVSYLVGFDGTSNTLAGVRHGIPVSGTMAHSYIITFASEAEAFRQFARSFPAASTFLVDTYDTVGGTRKAALVAWERRRQGHSLQAIRLDSGDLLDLSRQARALLDEAGLPDVQMFASGGWARSATPPGATCYHGGPSRAPTGRRRRQPSAPGALMRRLRAWCRAGPGPPSRPAGARSPRRPSVPPATKTRHREATALAHPTGGMPKLSRRPRLRGRRGRLTRKWWKREGYGELAGWPRVVTHPGLPQTRICAP